MTVAAASDQAAAASPSAQRGLVIARTYCARCHAIDKVSRENHTRDELRAGRLLSEVYNKYGTL